ncbi:BPSS1187 family protein [Hymenobacter negativus]|uniref:Alpha/beta hydrolase n=1 Tax=Hymenobacter negativus TaxID=2795026 RepID=A0ABS3QK80_9BACT|nr:hypothetical protein [Hymenobacter negativus]MBO2011651.1 hypothetical protein [Hymenobacter negativus]
MHLFLARCLHRRLLASLVVLLTVRLPLGAQTLRTAVVPSATDPSIDAFDSEHTLYRNPAVASRHELLIFLPGTSGKTRGTSLFCTTAANLGYHVICLMYPDEVSASICRNSPDSTAFDTFRRTIIEGGTSTFITVSCANSIDNRLLKLLFYLRATRPAEDWGQFLQTTPKQPAGGASEEPAWERLALAGQSQGGGHAALLASRHRVARVLLFSSPKDWSRYYNRPAAWYAASQTPADRYYAFVHEQDQQGCTYTQQLKILNTLHLGNPQSVDNAAPPYQHAHALSTNYPGTLVTSQVAHTSEVGDGQTPKKADGTPLFQLVWQYMLTAK